MASVTEPSVSSGQTRDAALDRYQRRLRRPRIVYAATVVAAVVALVVVTVVAYFHGEISHTHLRTVRSAPSAPVLRPTPRTLTTKWRSTDSSAIGTPYYLGTVVTYDRHTVRGRDALTGRPTWSYTRSDRTVCTAIQVDGVTIAVYRLGGNCDELTALDSNTGARRWTRTLDKDGAHFDGPASWSVMSGNVLLVSRTSVYALSPTGTADTGNGGLDYWTFFHPGCTINGAVLGSAGALIAQTCHGLDCGTLQFCANGPQLLLRDATAGSDSSSQTNPDKVTWLRRGVTLRPLSAGSTVSALTADGSALELLNAGSGAPTGRLSVAAGSAAPAAPTTTSTGTLFWLGNTTYALDDGAGSFAWRRATTGPPSFVAKTAPGAGDSDIVTVPLRDGAARVNPDTGSVTAHYHVPGLEPGQAATPLGAGLLLSGATTAYAA